MEHPVLLYDGLCGLCNWTVQFVVRHDQEKIFRFASLQSPFAGRVLAPKRIDTSDLNTVYLVVFCEEREVLLQSSEAVLFVMRKLTGVWPTMARVLRLLPRGVRDWAYRVVARNRYRIFGKYSACPVPSEVERDRFVEV